MCPLAPGVENTSVPSQYIVDIHLSHNESFRHRYKVSSWPVILLGLSDRKSPTIPSRVGAMFGKSVARKWDTIKMEEINSWKAEPRDNEELNLTLTLK